MNLYAVVDIVSNKVYEVGLGDSDGAFVRANLPILSRTKPVTDIKIYRVAEVNVDFKDKLTSFFWSEFEGVEVPTDSYKFDEVTAEHISKTEAVQQIEMYRKARELQIQKMQAEIDKIKSETRSE